jgi:hypothetical protein
MLRYAPSWSVQHTASLCVARNNVHLCRRLQSIQCLRSQDETAVYAHMNRCLQIRRGVGRCSRISSFPFVKEHFWVPYRYPISICLSQFSSVSQGDLMQGREDNQKKQRRFFSAKISDTANTSRVNSGEMSSSSNPSVVKPDRATDPDFASYLTGEMKPPSILDELTKLSSGAVISQRRSSAAKRSRSFALDTNDKEVYRQIIDLQASQREKSRQKTFINVYRALMGNVIICTGTLLIYVHFFLFDGVLMDLPA